ncbi:hypothetical protein GCM10009007_05490 [Formosimonas limnophila]|uniref:Uncharacterized protein n=1 Tax=Formosimonas limnophila TaxID=1384487 RepID=A0A8J3CG12_9BURK|nr:hypothetical protein [Formosimonas limnophila]GHA67694.1 hypothetical protein GCM10009007_05490 [Formosimonas limnophila]
MRKTLIVTLLTTAIPTTYAEEAPTIIKTAKEAAKELKIPCQKLKVAKNDCVIAHFKSQDAEDLMV